MAESEPSLKPSSSQHYVCFHLTKRTSLDFVLGTKIEVCFGPESLIQSLDMLFHIIHEDQ